MIPYNIPKELLIRSNDNGLVRSFIPKPNLINKDLGFEKLPSSFHDETNMDGGIRTIAHEVKPLNYTELQKVHVRPNLENVKPLKQKTMTPKTKFEKVNISSTPSRNEIIKEKSISTKLKKLPLKKIGIGIAILVLGYFIWKKYF